MGSTTVSMFERQQSPDDLWHLAPGQALSLSAGPGARVLSVVDGLVWLTFDGRREQPAGDIWLRPGESLALAHGDRLVAEAYSSASFRLSVPPSVCRQAVRQRREASAQRGASVGARGGLCPA